MDVGILLNNERLLDIVKHLEPLDIVDVLVRDVSLSPHDASKLALSLIKKSEGMMSPGIETNKMFPVPSSMKRDDPKFFDIEDLEESEFGKTSGTPKHDFQRHQFPPDPIEEPGDWPYDDMTIQGMDPSNKQRKRSITSSKKYVFKEPFRTDFSTTSPGGPGAPMYRKGLPHARGNSTSSDSSSWSKQGVAGWSSSLSGKEFDLPSEEPQEPQDVEEVDDNGELPGNEIEFLKNLPVGASIPKFVAGRSEPRRMGFRKR